MILRDELMEEHLPIRVIRQTVKACSIVWPKTQVYLMIEGRR